MRKTLTNMLAALAFIPAIALAVPVSAAASSPDFGRAGSCTSQDVNVALAPGQGAKQTVHTIYCQPHHWAHGEHQTDVLTEGATYNSTYWMWPQQPNRYSYVKKTLRAGRAVFTYDRLGSGQSSRPVSTDITVASDGYVLYQLINNLRQQGVQVINSIGHSYGSGIALDEAARYGHVDRLILTGYLHRPSNPAVTAGNYPANQDPMFAGQGLDDGYLTTRPGARQTSFYSSSADPNVIAYDEAHKDLVSATGLGSFIAERNVAASGNMSQNVRIPVFELVGDQDAIFCYDPSSFDCSDQSALNTNESPYFTNASSFEVASVPNTGHDLALHPSANRSFRLIDHWINTH